MEAIFYRAVVAVSLTGVLIFGSFSAYDLQQSVELVRLAQLEQKAHDFAYPVKYSVEAGEPTVFLPSFPSKAVESAKAAANYRREDALFHLRIAVIFALVPLAIFFLLRWIATGRVRRLRPK